MVLLFTLSNGCFASEWRYLGTDDHGGNFAIDLSSLKWTGHLVRFWRKAEYSKPISLSSSPNQYFSKFVALSEVNCRENTIGTLYETVYAENGEIVSESAKVNRHPEMVPIAPDTVNETLANKVCHKKTID